MPRTLTALALLLALTAPAFAQTQTAGDLAWTFNVGDVHGYTFSWDFLQKEELGPQMVLKEIRLQIVYTLEEKVTAVSGGVASIEAKVTSLQASVDPKMMGMPMGKMEFDSKAEDAPNNMLRALREAVGKSFSFKISTMGTVSSVSGGQAIRDAVAEVAKKQSEELKKRMGGGGMGGGGMGGMMGPDMIGMLASRISVAFDDQTLESTLNVVNDLLPEGGKSSKGQSWTRDVVEQLPQLGSVKFKGKYTHQGAKDGATKITFFPEGKVALEKAASGGGDEYQEQEKAGLTGMEVTNTEASGTASFGPGHLVVSEVVQQIDAEGDIPPGSPIAGMAKPGEKIAARFKLTLRYERSRAK